MERNRLINLVTERGGLADATAAERATKATYQTLAERVVKGEARDLAAQLPDDLGEALVVDTERETFGCDEFVRRVSERTELDEEAARRAAQAVFTTTAEAVTSGEYRQVVDMLPDDYRPLVSTTA